MDIIHVDKLPPGHEYYDSSEFSEWDLKNLEAAGVQRAAYWYGYDTYEGTGAIVMQINDRWYQHNCGHCSCYGPTENLEVRGLGHATPQDLLDNCSKEWRSDLQPLVDALNNEPCKP